MANLTTEMMTIVSANTKPYVAAMNRGAQSTSMFSRIVKSSMTRVVASIGTVVSAAAAARIALKALELGAAAEQTQVAFEVLTGSASKASKLVDELNKFAAATPFQSDDLKQASKSLLAFGFATDEILPNLKTLGELSAGMGINIGELAEIFGKARVQGRLFMEDINQLTGRGINVNDVLLAQFKDTSKSLRELVEDGEVNFGHLQKAFQELTKEGAQFGGMMEKQSKTFNGAMSTMRDNASLILQDIGGEFIKAFPLEKISSNIQKFVSENRESIGEKLKGAFTQLRESIFNVADAFGIFAGSALVMQGHLLDGTSRLVKLNSKMIDGFLVGMKLLSGLNKLSGDTTTSMVMDSIIQQIEQGNDELVTAANEFQKLGKLSVSSGVKLAQISAAGGIEKALRELFNVGGDSFWAKARKKMAVSASSSGSTATIANQTSGPSFWNRATEAGKNNRSSGWQSLLSFGGGIAGVGSALSGRFLTDVMAMAGQQMAPNNAILKGSSQAVSLEAERNRAQLDVGKSQLDVMRSMDDKLSRLVDFGSGQLAKAADAFGGLF